jgi:glycosyltransferase 2 family protein
MEFIRRRLGLILRAAVSILCVVLVVRSANWGDVWNHVRTMNVRWLLAGFLAFAPTILIVSWRWRLLLGAHGVFLKYWRVLELNMIGQFFSAFLVGTTGGDVVKIFYVARNVPAKKAAVGFTVIVDRVIGMVAMLFLGVVLSFTQLPLLTSTHFTSAATGMFYLFAAGGVIASIGATFAPLFLKRPAIRALLEKLPFASRISQVLAAYEVTARAFGRNFVALIISIPSQLCILLMGYCITLAMHLPPPPLLAFCSILTIVNMLIALPVSMNGVGVRELLFKSFLGLLGLDGNTAVTFSLTFFVLNLVWSLLGGAFYHLYRHETHIPAPHVSEDQPILSQI